MRYVKPEIEIVKFDTEDIMLASSSPSSGTPASQIDGVEATPLDVVEYASFF